MKVSRWTIKAVIAYVLGAALAFGSATISLNVGTTPNGLTALLTTYVVIGTLIAGLGQLLRAAAHGSTTGFGRGIDGWGKVIGLFGWSLALVGAVFFAMNETDTPQWVLSIIIIGIITVPIVFIAFVAAKFVISPSDSDSVTPELDDLPVGEVIDGTNWWAMVEGDNRYDTVAGKRAYAKVIAWERVDDLGGEPGNSGLVAWLNGNQPVRSDRVSKETSTWIFNQFTQSPPEGFNVWVWS